MRVSQGRGPAALSRTDDESLLEQERLDDVSQRVRLFLEGGGQRLDANRAAAVARDDRRQHLAVQIVQAFVVDAFEP